MVLQYNVCGVELPIPVIFHFPGLFTYPFNIHDFLLNLSPDLPYPGLFTYNLKALIPKPDYYFKISNN